MKIEFADGARVEWLVGGGLKISGQRGHQLGLAERNNAFFSTESLAAAEPDTVLTILKLAAERDRAVAAADRVRALFSGGPDTPCWTHWIDDVEHVMVPMADLRAALDDGDSE